MLSVEMPRAYEFIFKDIPVPEPDKDQIIIQMKRVGICGSDIQVYHGRHKYMTFPVVQGHEGSGVVAQTGSGVKNVKVGDRVTVQPQIFCESCRSCRTGHYNVCDNLKVYGIHTNGMATEYFKVPASKVLKLPDNMSFDEGALVEPTAVAVGTVRRAGNIEGSNIVVLGAGPIGNLVAQAARQKGAAKVMISDINQKRLDLAMDCGIKYCVNPEKIGLKEAILKFMGEDEADIIIDCAATSSSIHQAIDSARCASKIVIVGNFKEPVEIEMPKLQRREVDLISVMMYVRRDYEEAIRLIAAGEIQAAKLISNHFNVYRFKEAYEFIDSHSNDVMKVMMNFEE